MRVRSLAAVSSLVALFCLPYGTVADGQSSFSPLVKVTPLGSHSGELCRNDRALMFEDPSGVRILYDPGRTVDETDSRLGAVHVMLLSHAHADHIGDTRASPGGGTCAAPAAGAANPNGNFSSIAAAKNAAVLAPGELSGYLSRKIQNIRGAATAACPEVGLTNVFDVPLGAPCTASLRPGGSRGARRAGTDGPGVRIAAVQAVHSNGVPAALVDSPGEAPGLSGYGGSEAGFVITFTNGLVAYLTGDTGMFGDMSAIISRYYRPTLVVLNMSDTVTLGPNEAAFVVRSLIRPRSVMPSHVNEQATSDGAVRGGTRVDLFREQVRDAVDVIVPISDVTRSFDSAGRCIGCR
jgi:L-ascorbate metabolism protein UlaG (beta-lactamase superfamily)